MTTIRTILAATALAGSLAAATSASAATFVVNNVVGSGFVAGTITTDGTIGALSASNITAWSLMLNDGTTSQTISKINSGLLVYGGLSATAAGLFFNFSDINALVDFQGPQPGSSINFWCMDGANRGCAGYGGSSFYVKSTGFSQMRSVSGNAQIATIAAVPEPATWAMMLVGFGMLGAAMRYRRSGARVVYA